jgi:hypothetical protein
MDDYQKKYVEQIKKAQNDEDLEKTIDRIYEDGFQDGQEED